MKTAILTLILFSVMTTQAIAVSKEEMLRTEVEMNVIDPCLTALVWLHIDKNGRLLSKEDISLAMKIMKMETKGVDTILIDMIVELIMGAKKGIGSYKNRMGAYSVFVKSCIAGGSK